MAADGIERHAKPRRRNGLTDHGNSEVELGVTTPPSLDHKTKKGEITEKESALPFLFCDGQVYCISCMYIFKLFSHKGSAKKHILKADRPSNFFQ